MSEIFVLIWVWLRYQDDAVRQQALMDGSDWCALYRRVRTSIRPEIPARDSYWVQDPKLRWFSPAWWVATNKSSEYQTEFLISYLCWLLWLFIIFILSFSCSWLELRLLTTLDNCKNLQTFLPGLFFGGGSSSSPFSSFSFSLSFSFSFSLSFFLSVAFALVAFFSFSFSFSLLGFLPRLLGFSSDLSSPFSSSSSSSLSSSVENLLNKAGFRRCYSYLCLLAQQISSVSQECDVIAA